MWKNLQITELSDLPVTNIVPFNCTTCLDVPPHGSVRTFRTQRLPLAGTLLHITLVLVVVGGQIPQFDAIME